MKTMKNTQEKLRPLVSFLSGCLLVFILCTIVQTQLHAAETMVLQAAPEASFTSNQQKRNMTEFKGKKILLWLFSNWCHTCAAGVKALADRHSVFKQSDMSIIALRNYKNGGYPGPDINDFIQHFSPQAEQTQHWITGEASREMAQRYNAQQYPDIYFLIDAQGIIQEQGTAPGVFINKIVQFSQGINPK